MENNVTEVKVEVEKPSADSPPPLPPKPGESPVETVIEEDTTSEIDWDKCCKFPGWDACQMCCGMFFLLLCITTAGACLIIICTNVISIVLIFMGSYFIYDCPENNLIPISLIVQGVIQILQIFLKYLGKNSLQRKADPDATEEKSWPQRILGYLSIGWFVNGSFRVYTSYEPSYNPLMAPNYCNKTLYKFAFWYYSLFYIFLVCVIVCVGCYECFKLKRDKSKQPTNAV